MCLVLWIAQLFFSQLTTWYKKGLKPLIKSSFCMFLYSANAAWEVVIDLKKTPSSYLTKPEAKTTLWGGGEMYNM